jgi:hypothetical protein
MRVSLEIAHTMLGPQAAPSREAERSCLIGRDLHRLLQTQGHEVDVDLLIDDKPVLGDEKVTDEVDKLLDQISEFVPVTHWTLERRLSAYVDKLLNLLSSPVARENRQTYLCRYFDDYGSLPCSTDIAIWHLLRLGLIDDSHGIFNGISEARRPADHVISVLPEYLNDHEDSADAHYLKRLGRPIADRIHRLYFPVSPEYDRAKLDRRVRQFTAQFEADTKESGK